MLQCQIDVGLGILSWNLGLTTSDAVSIIIKINFYSKMPTKMMWKPVTMSP